MPVPVSPVPVDLDFAVVLLTSAWIGSLGLSVWSLGFVVGVWGLIWDSGFRARFRV